MDKGFALLRAALAAWSGEANGPFELCPGPAPAADVGPPAPPRPLSPEPAPALSPIITVGQPDVMTPPWVVRSPIRAACMPPINTVAEPLTMASGGPAQVAMSPTRAAGIPPMKTVGQQGGTIGPPTCGTGPGFTNGQVCISVIRAAGGIVKYQAFNNRSQKELSDILSIAVGVSTMPPARSHFYMLNRQSHELLDYQREPKVCFGSTASVWARTDYFGSALMTRKCVTSIV